MDFLSIFPTFGSNPANLKTVVLQKICFNGNLLVLNDVYKLYVLVTKIKNHDHL